MKQAQLIDVITKRLKKMKKLSGQVLENFNEDDIHNLRVEYKKLRSFIRMIQLGAVAPKLKVPGKLKSVYIAGGPVRDLQLFIPRLLPHFIHKSSQVFLIGLQEKLELAKQELAEAIKRVDYEKAEVIIIGSLPGNLNNEVVKEFVESKIMAVKAGLDNIRDDEDLHSVRKQLKDLINVIKVYRNEWKLPFPVNTGISEEDLNHIGTILGDYNDLCFAISLLQLYKDQNLPFEESSTLDNLYKTWVSEKEFKLQEAMQMLTHLL